MRLINQCLPLRRLPALYYPTPRIMAQKRKANGATHVQVYSTRRSSQRIAKQDTVTVYTEEDTIALEPKRVKQAKQTPKHKPAKSTKPITIKAGPRNEEDYDATHQVDEDVAVLPPRFDSDQLPLPWKGRLGYACLNTYLRTANPPIFSSRTCRIASILDHRHPLQNPDEPEHPTKNRPDKAKPADIQRGMDYVQNIGLANAKDIIPMIRWNDKYGIKFMRLSSYMFPFASHPEYGYDLDFAADVLAEAGKLAGELGHRLTTHPGQYTQIASPLKEVVTASFRDLDYHNDMLTRLRLPEQADRDAVMILHMGGTYGDKDATVDRFRENYAKLSPGVKKRLVLENDDVSWSVHDLLPLCEELNVPLVLDYHHHDIIHDPSVRDGTLDIIPFYDRIAATWKRKGIAQKMHYSEPTEGAVTQRERRKHSPRVENLPPCPNDMDLMIEAKDKEQAVFELMKKYKLPGWELFNEVIPHERDDEPRAAITKKMKKIKGQQNEVQAETIVEEKIIPPSEVSMGGPGRRVYWPPGNEDWLSPKKRARKKIDKDSDRE